MLISIFYSNLCLHFACNCCWLCCCDMMAFCVDPLLRIHTLINSHTFEHVHTNDRESCVEEPNYNPHIYEKGGAKSTIT